MSFLRPATVTNAVMQWRPNYWLHDGLVVANIVNMQQGYWAPSLAGGSFVFNYPMLRTADGVVYIYMDVATTGYFTTGAYSVTSTLLAQYRPAVRQEYILTLQPSGHTMSFVFLPQTINNMVIDRPLAAGGVYGNHNAAAGGTIGFSWRGV